jgi:hypothetical protein
MKNVRENRTGRPPVWAERLLRALLAQRSQDAIAGDLLEEYREVLPAVGTFRARIWYLRQVMSFLDVVDALDVAEKISRPLLWGTAAALFAYVLIFAIPSATEIPFNTLLFLFTGIILIAGSTTAIRKLEHRWPLFRIGCIGLVSFATVTAVVLSAPVFRPAIIMGTFLVIAAATGFRAAWITGLARAGIVVSVATGTAGAVLLFVTVDVLNHPHPPLLAAFALPVMAAISGTIGAVLGKHFGSPAAIFSWQA